MLDIPLLFEGLGDQRVDATLVVSAPVFLQRHRVMARPGMTADRLDGILRQQVPDVLKRHKADIVIPTGLGLAPTRAALAKAVSRAQAPARPLLAAQSLARETHSPSCASPPQIG